MLELSDRCRISCVNAKPLMHPRSSSFSGKTSMLSLNNLSTILSCPQVNSFHSHLPNGPGLCFLSFLIPPLPPPLPWHGLSPDDTSRPTIIHVDCFSLSMVASRPVSSHFVFFLVYQGVLVRIRNTLMRTVLACNYVFISYQSIPNWFNREHIRHHNRLKRTRQL